MITEFRCPKCDSTKFGGLPTRKCHGILLHLDPKDSRIVPVSCEFSWDHTEDWKYERVVVVKTGPKDKCQEVASQAVLDYMRTAPREELIG